MPEWPQLDNRTSLHDLDIWRVVAATPARADGLLVIIGADRAVRTYGGEAIARELWDAGITFGDNTPLNEHDAEQWSAAVQIWEGVTTREGFSAYFAYLLAHELGHAWLIQHDLSLHSACCALKEAAAALHPGNWSEEEFPDEQLFDRLGVAVADTFFGRRALEARVAALLQDPERIDHDRLKTMLRIAPTFDLSGLRAAVREFTADWRGELDEWARAELTKCRERDIRTVLEFANPSVLFGSSSST